MLRGFRNEERKAYPSKKAWGIETTMIRGVADRDHLGSDGQSAERSWPTVASTRLTTETLKLEAHEGTVTDLDATKESLERSIAGFDGTNKRLGVSDQAIEKIPIIWQ